MKNSVLRIISFVMALSIAFSLFVLPTSAVTTGETADGFYYSLYDGFACIDGYYGTEAEIVIPTEIEGLPVTQIFSLRSKSFTSPVTSVTISDGVTSISSNAFSLLDQLTSIKVSDGNASYSSIDGVLADKDGTTLISYPCARSATEYTVPDGIVSIDSGCFHSAKSLETVNIPASVTRIINNIFSVAANLKAINVSEENTVFSSVDGVLYNKDKTEILSFPRNKGSVSFEIPNTVKTVGYGSFANVFSLTEVTFPSSVKTIEDSAFTGCYGLVELRLPNANSIGSFAFGACTGLTKIYYAGTEEKWNSFGCYLDNVVEMEFGDEVDPLEVYNFTDWGEYITITGYKGKEATLKFPSEIEGKPVTEISSTIFDYCENVANITKIVIPATVTNIYYGTFKKCVSLTEFEVEEGSESFKTVDGLLCTTSGALISYPAGLTASSFEVPAGITSINNSAFLGVTALTQIKLSADVNYVTTEALSELALLTDITVAEGNRSFSSVDGVLYNKKGDTVTYYPRGKSGSSYEISSSVTSIGGYAFYKVDALTSLVIPNTVKTVNSYAFGECTSLDTIVFDGTESEWDALTKGYNWDYNTGKNTDDQTYTVEFTTFVGTCGQGLSWKLADGILSVSGTGSMGEWSLDAPAPWNEHKDLIKNVVVEDGVADVGAYAFYGCTALKSAELPAGVLSVGGYAFGNCSALESLTFNGTEAKWEAVEKAAEWNTGAGTGTDEGTYILECTVVGGTCGDALIWELDPEGVLTISGEGEMYDWAVVATFSLRSAAVAAPWSEYKDLIKKVVVEEGVEKIGAYAFYDCPNLKSAEIPASIENIGSGAFGACEALDTVTYLGTESEWNAVTKGENWNDNAGSGTTEGQYDMVFSPAVIYGDATGDTVIDNKDLVRIKKYLAAYDYDTQTSTVAIELGADATGDGIIDNKDLVRLKKYLAAYDYDTNTSSVVLGPIE